MSQIQFIQVTPQQLQEVVQTAVNTSMATFLANFKPKQDEEYLTRTEVAEILKVDVSTVYNWTRAGRLKSYGIGSRVYYKRSDIDTHMMMLEGSF